MRSSQIGCTERTTIPTDTILSIDPDIALDTDPTGTAPESITATTTGDIAQDIIAIAGYTEMDSISDTMTSMVTDMTTTVISSEASTLSAGTAISDFTPTTVTIITTATTDTVIEAAVIFISTPTTHDATMRKVGIEVVTTMAISLDTI